MSGIPPHDARALAMALSALPVDETVEVVRIEYRKGDDPAWRVLLSRRSPVDGVVVVGPGRSSSPAQALLDAVGPLIAAAEADRVRLLS